MNEGNGACFGGRGANRRKRHAFEARVPVDKANTVANPRGQTLTKRKRAFVANARALKFVRGQFGKERAQSHQFARGFGVATL